MTILLIIFSFSIGFVIGALMTRARHMRDEEDRHIVLFHQLNKSINHRRCQAWLRAISRKLEREGMEPWRMN